jgi:hypothetical protein
MSVKQDVLDYRNRKNNVESHCCNISWFILQQNYKTKN